MPGACKHQCRRKALSTPRTGGEAASRSVQTSVSPQGVEHFTVQTRREMDGGRANISVAARR